VIPSKEKLSRPYALLEARECNESFDLFVELTYYARVVCELDVPEEVRRGAAVVFACINGPALADPGFVGMLRRLEAEGKPLFKIYINEAPPGELAFEDDALYEKLSAIIDAYGCRMDPHEEFLFFKHCLNKP